MGSIPNQIQVMLTERCNLRCRHCCVPEEESPAVSELSETEWRPFIAASAASGVLSFVLSGGEALLRADALALAQYAHECGIPQTVIVSNLVFEDGGIPTAIAALQRRHPGCHLQVSIDGASAATHDWMRGRGKFAALMEAATALSGAGASIGGVNSVIHQKNIHELDALAVLVHGLGARNWRVFPVAALGRGRRFPLDELGEEQWRDVLARLPGFRERFAMDVLAMGPIFADGWSADLADSPRPAGVGPSRCIVGPDGEVFLCPPLRDQRLGQVAAIGDTASFSGAMALASSLQAKSCPTCKYKLLCVGVDAATPFEPRPSLPYLAPG